jgi:hypothetical protein
MKKSSLTQRRQFNSTFESEASVEQREEKFSIKKELYRGIKYVFETHTGITTSPRLLANPTTKTWTPTSFTTSTMRPTGCSPTSDANMTTSRPPPKAERRKSSCRRRSWKTCTPRRRCYQAKSKQPSRSYRRLRSASSSSSRIARARC